MGNVMVIPAKRQIGNTSRKQDEKLTPSRGVL